MGKKIPFDLAEKLCGLKNDINDSIFAPPNKYGYKIAINHPQVKPFYEYYKEKLGENILSDNQRRTFEVAFMQMIKINGSDDISTK